jgi:hypothetical protein
LDRYHEILLADVDCSLAEFKRIYCTLHSLASLPDPYPQSQPARAAADAIDHSDSLFMTVAQQQQIRNAATRAPTTRTTEDTVASTLKRTLESIFTTSWSLYKRQSETNSIDLALQKLSIEHFDSKATEAAVMEIDMEPPASRQHLDGLIRASVSKQTKKLQNELQTLKAGLAKQTAAKNTVRGSASKPSASRKKKSPGTAQKAAAPANATSNATPKTNNRKSTQRSNGKNKNSNRQKQTSTRRSSNAST